MLCQLVETRYACMQERRGWNRTECFEKSRSALIRGIWLQQPYFPRVARVMLAVQTSVKVAMRAARTVLACRLILPRGGCMAAREENMSTS